MASYNGGVSYNGDKERAKGALKEALALANIVRFQKDQAGLASHEKIFDIDGGGTVRVVDMAHNRHIYIDMPPLPPPEEEEKEVLEISPESNCYAVFPQGHLGGQFFGGIPPSAPSFDGVGIVLADDNSIVKLSSGLLVDIFGWGARYIYQGAQSHLDWFSTSRAIRLFCLAGPETNKWEVGPSSTNALATEQTKTPTIYWRGAVVVDLRNEHAYPFGYENYVTGMGLFGNKILYATRPTGKTVGGGDVPTNTVSIWSLKLGGGTNGLGKAAGAVPVLVGSFLECTIADLGLSAPWTMTAAAFAKMWYHFSGSGAKAIRLQWVYKITGSPTPLWTLIDATYREELFFTTNEFDEDLVEFTRTFTAAGSITATHTKTAVLEIVPATTISTFEDYFYKVGGADPAAWYSNVANPEFTLTNDGADTTEDESCTATGSRVIAFDYADDENETLITLEQTVVSSTGTSSYTSNPHRLRTYRANTTTGAPYAPYEWIGNTLLSDVNTTIGGWTHSIACISNYVYTAKGEVYTMPYTNMTSDYTSSYKPFSGMEGSAAGTVTMRGQAPSLTTQLQGSWSAMDLRYGLFVSSVINSSETITGVDGSIYTYTITITRDDELYICKNGIKSVIALPNVSGVLTPGRPSYSLTDTPATEFHYPPQHSSGFFLEGLWCIHARDANPGSSLGIINAKWALYSGKNFSNLGPSFLGVGGSIAEATDESCFISLTSYSVEKTPTGWTTGASLPECKQAAYIVKYLPNGYTVHEVTERAWKSHEYGTYTQVPTELALVGSVEWAGSLDQTIFLEL